MVAGLREIPNITPHATRVGQSVWEDEIRGKRGSVLYFTGHSALLLFEPTSCVYPTSSDLHRLLYTWSSNHGESRPFNNDMLVFMYILFVGDLFLYILTYSKIRCACFPWRRTKIATYVYIDAILASPCWMSSRRKIVGSIMLTYTREYNYKVCIHPVLYNCTGTYANVFITEVIQSLKRSLWFSSIQVCQYTYFNILLKQPQ